MRGSHICQLCCHQKNAVAKFVLKASVITFLYVHTTVLIIIYTLEFYHFYVDLLFN